MSILLLLLGILACGSGLAAIGYGISLEGSDLGRTLIMAGTTGLTGGLILVGLAAAVRQLARIAEGLRTRPQPRPVRPPELQPRFEAPEQRSEPLPPRVEPVAPLAEIPTYAPRAPLEPRPATTPADVSSSAIERLRSTLPRPDRVVPEAEDVPLSPNGTSSPRAAEPAQPNPATGRPGASEVETARQPHLDFLFRSRAPRTGQPDSFDSLWPKRSTRQHEAPGEADEVSSPATQAPTAAETLPAEEQRMAPEVAAPVADEPPSVAILKSGVVDGMAYTLYADGSIEAQLPQGTVRFASITELRAHIENHS